MTLLIKFTLPTKYGIITKVLPCPTTFPTQLMLVRWFRSPHIRKPFYLGTAKSKLLRFPNWHPYDPGEREEMQKLTCDYRNATKSLFAYFKQEYAKVSETSHIALEMHRAEEEEHARLMEENRLENERVAKLREARIAAQVKERQERLLRSFVRAEEEDKERMKEAEEVVRQAKEIVKSCITLEMLDAAIDQALATEVDYNFAIDLDGNVYKGKYTNKLQKPETEARATS